MHDKRKTAAESADWVWLSAESDVVPSGLDGKE